jgi:putative intracellular protease/amidase
VTASATGARRAGTGDGVPGSGQGRAPAERPLLVIGAMAAGLVAAAGLAVIILLVLAGWIAAPHSGASLPAVLRTAAALWLVAQHVGFTFRGAGRIGLLPLGLVLLPGALLWRAGRWVVRAGAVSRLRHVGYAAVALAVPYALLTAVLALASRSVRESASLPQAVACGFLLALAAGGLGGARALAPWPRLIGLLPDRQRSLVIAVAGTLAALVAAGAVLAGASVAMHLHEAATLERDLAPGAVGTLLLLLLQLSYMPNAIVWAIAFSLGPGFACGSATVVAPTGSALTQLPAFPLLAALPPGLHPAMPGWIEPTVLALPYLAGALGGLLLIRAAPALALDAAPLWGLACGGVCGSILALLAAASGGPLGNGRLAAVGPSPWQVGVVSALEIGVAAAVTAGTANYFALRRAGALSGQAERAARDAVAHVRAGQAAHVIYVDPWAGDPPPDARAARRGPSALP